MKIVFAIIAALILVSPARSITLSSETCSWVTVQRVIDGDTVEVDGKKKVRLIGVDTPETKHPKKGVEFFGKEAYAYTRQELLEKRVCLKADSKGGQDRYKRILAFLYLKNGTLFNADLVSNGYAKAYLKFPFSKSELFKRLEQNAKLHRRGMWAFTQ